MSLKHLRSGDELRVPGNGAAYNEPPRRPHTAPQQEASYPQQQPQQMMLPPQQMQMIQSRRVFPPSMNAYLQGGFSSNVLLGEHGDQPLYTVSTHTGFSGKPPLILHAGPDTKAPWLATVNNGSMFTRSFKVNLPPQAGEVQGDDVVRVHATGSFTSKFQFAMDIGNGSVESFEWRRTRGNEVRMVESRLHGWKLVRLDSPVQSEGGGRHSRPIGSTSDGKEVVMIWTRYGGFSMDKCLQFRFVGSAAALGDRWEMVALMSALRIFFLEEQAKRNQRQAQQRAHA